MIKFSSPQENRYGEQQKKHDPAQERRLQMIYDFGHRYKNVHDKTGLGNSSRLRATLEWLKETLPTDDPNEINNLKSREEFIRGYGGDILRHGEKMHRQFYEQMDRAGPYISQSSYDRWVKERFLNDSIGFQEKKYWIERQMAGFVDGWIEVGKERDRIAKLPEMKDAIRIDPELAILMKRTDFLNLHFDKRKGLIAQAKAAMESYKKKHTALYAQAKVKLHGAEKQEILASGKVGTWLERIFTADAKTAEIDAFVNETGPKTLHDLMNNWSEVKERFDIVKKKIRERGEGTASRGFTLLSEGQFLALHYEERLHYVEEAEMRVGETKDVNEELPIFLKIRHAMDIKDWQEADGLIMEARTMGLTGKDHERLNSMDSFVKQFSGRKQSTEGTSNIMEAKHRMDRIVEELGSTHSELQPMIMRLLGGPNGNRSIHQFRWIVYNNKWCRTHGYLDNKIARKGASQQNKDLTKLRATEGSDIGRNDVLDADTQGQHFIRKREYANHKATLMHANVGNAAGSNTLAEWLEHERDPKVLYWTTYCAHENGEPKSANWHDDLFVMLTELRSLSRTVNGAGYMYGGPGNPLLQKASGGPRVRHRGASGAKSHALAA